MLTSSDSYHRTVSVYAQAAQSNARQQLAGAGEAFGSPMHPAHPKAADQRPRSATHLQLAAPEGYDRSLFAGSSDDEEYMPRNMPTGLTDARTTGKALTAAAAGAHPTGKALTAAAAGAHPTVGRSIPTHVQSTGAGAPLHAAGPQPYGLQAVHESLQDMLATAARLHGEMLSSGSGGHDSAPFPPPSFSHLAVWPQPQAAPEQTALAQNGLNLQASAPPVGSQYSVPPGHQASSGLAQRALSSFSASRGGVHEFSTSRYVGGASANGQGSSGGAPFELGLDSGRGSAGGSSISGRPGGGQQSRGPLEALRDEIFGGFSLPAPTAVPPQQTVTSAPAVYAPVMAARHSSSQLGGASSLSSPTPSMRERTVAGHEAGHALHDEHSTMTTSQAMHSVADLSSIYSMPESALNAVANTPMSFTTAAVSELDTPSSPRSHGDEELDRLPSVSPRSSARNLGLVSPGGSITPPAVGGGRLFDISSGYDDYVQPAAWTSLRERHSTSHASAMTGSMASAPRSTARTGAAGGGTGTHSLPPMPSLDTPEDRAGSRPERSAGAAAPDPQALMSASTSLSGPGMHSSRELGLASLSSLGSDQQPQRPQLQVASPRAASPFGSIAGGGGGSAGGSSGQPTPTMARGFGSVAGVASGGGAALPSGGGRERSSSGQFLRSLSFGIPPSSPESTPGSGRASAVSLGGGGGLGVGSASEAVLSAAADASDAGGASPRHPSAVHARFSAGLSPLGSGQAGGQIALGSMRGTPRADDDDGTPIRNGLGGMSFVNPLFAFEASPTDGEAGQSSTDGTTIDNATEGVGAQAADYRPKSEGRSFVGRVDDLHQSAARKSMEEPVAYGLRESGPPSNASARSGVAAAGAPAPSAADSPVLRGLTIAAWVPNTSRPPSTGGRLPTLAEHGADGGVAMAANALLPELETGRSASASTPRAHSSPRASVASRASLLGAPGAGPPSPAQQLLSQMPTPWLDPATAAAAAGVSSGASPRRRGSAVALLTTSIGGASSFSGMSAAAVSAMPSQDRVERVRSWAEEGADFGARPLGSGSMGGAAVPSLETPSSTSEGIVAAALLRSVDGAEGGSGGFAYVERDRPPVSASAEFESPGGESADFRITMRTMVAVDHADQPAVAGAAAAAYGRSALVGMMSPIGGGFAQQAVVTPADEPALLSVDSAEPTPRDAAIGSEATAAPGGSGGTARTKDATDGDDASEAAVPHVAIGSTGLARTEEPAAGQVATAVPLSAASITADLEQLLSRLAGRGARSEVHPRHQAGLDSLASAVVDAAGFPRTNSAPGLAPMAMPEAPAETEAASEPATEAVPELATEAVPEPANAQPPTEPVEPEAQGSISAWESPSSAPGQADEPAPPLEPTVTLSPASRAFAAEGLESRPQPRSLPEREMPSEQRGDMQEQQAREGSPVVHDLQPDTLLQSGYQHPAQVNSSSQAYHAQEPLVLRPIVAPPLQPLLPLQMPVLPSQPQYAPEAERIQAELALQQEVVDLHQQQPLIRQQQQHRQLEPEQQQASDVTRRPHQPPSGAHQQLQDQVLRDGHKPQQAQTVSPSWQALSRLQAQHHAIDVSASLGSLDSEFAAERLKAKTRAFLAAPPAASGAGIPAAWPNRGPHSSVPAPAVKPAPDSAQVAAGAPLPPPPPSQAPLPAQEQTLSGVHGGAGGARARAAPAPLQAPSSLDDILQSLQLLLVDNGGAAMGDAAGAAANPVDDRAVVALPAVDGDGGRKRRSSSGTSGRSRAREAARAEWQREQQRLQDQLWAQREAQQQAQEQARQRPDAFPMEDEEEHAERSDLLMEAEAGAEGPSEEHEDWAEAAWRLRQQEEEQREQQRRQREEVEERAVATLHALQQLPNAGAESNDGTQSGLAAAGRGAAPAAAGGPKGRRQAPSLGSVSLRGSWTSRGSPSVVDDWDHFPDPSADNSLADLSPWSPDHPPAGAAPLAERLGGALPLRQAAQAQRQNTRSPNRRTGRQSRNISQARSVLARVQQERPPSPDSQRASEVAASDTQSSETSSAVTVEPRPDGSGANSASVAQDLPRVGAAGGDGGEEPASSYLDLTAKAAQLRKRLEATAEEVRPQESTEEGTSGQDAWPQDPRLRYLRAQLLEEQKHQHQHLKDGQSNGPQSQHHADAQMPLPRPVASGADLQGLAGNAVPPAPIDWQAALQAKLMPPDAVQKRAHADGYLVLDALGAAPRAEVRQFPQSAREARGSNNAPANAAAVRRPSRAASPAGARGRRQVMSAAGGVDAAAVAGARQSEPGAGPHSAPVSPTKDNSPTRADGPAPAMAAAAVHAYPGVAHDNGLVENGGMGNAAAADAAVKSPRKNNSRGRRAPVANAPNGGAGGSILDRAAPRNGGAAVSIAPPTEAPPSPSQRRAPSPPQQAWPLLSDEPISIRRPLAWQERETRHWLEDLGVRLTPAEESAPLLDNPLRNGTLLSALAAALTGSPLPPGLLSDPPTDVRSARTNILCALDHLGLLAASWEPPVDGAQRGRAQLAEQPVAAGAGGVGRSRSPGPGPNSAGPTAGSSGIIAIKALGSAGRGYALRLKERQLRAGPGLAAEVEGVLAGSSDAVWGLLNLIRLAVGRQRLSGGGSAASGGAARRSAEPPGMRRPLDVRGGPGVNGTAGLGPAPAVAAAGYSGPGSPGRSRNAGTGSGAPGSPPRSPARHQSAQPSRAATPPRGAAAAPQAAAPGGRAGSAARGGMQAPPGAFTPGLPLNGPSGTAAPAAVPAAFPSEHGGGAGLLYRPLYPRLAALPYSASQLAALESSLLRWLAEIGAISVREASQGFAAVLPLLSDGTLICWLASNLSGTPIVGAHKRPRAPAARRSNWLKAISVLRSLPGMSRRCLAYEEALAAGERPALTGLLEDLHRAATGAEPAPSAFLPDAQPYLPYVVPEPAVEVLPFERIALNRGAATPSPVRGPPEAGAAARAHSPASPRRPAERPVSVDRMPRRQDEQGAAAAPPGGYSRPRNGAAPRQGACANAGAGSRGLITDYMVTPYKAALPPSTLLAAAAAVAPGGPNAAARRVQQPTAAWGLEAYLRQHQPLPPPQQQRQKTPPRQAWPAEGAVGYGAGARVPAQQDPRENNVLSPRLRLVPTAGW